MATFFIAGASRGIGLALVIEALSENPSNKVIAGVRSTDNKELNTIAASHPNRVTLVKLDVDADASAKEAAVSISQQFPEGIDYLLYNAAIHGHDADSYAGIVNAFNTNTVGALRAVDAFVPLLKKGSKKTILFISSQAGSYSYQATFAKASKVINNKAYGYRISKTALNFLAHILAIDLAEDGIKVNSCHPGTVDTDMIREILTGSSEEFKAKLSLITPETSAKLLVEFVVKSKPEDSGKFFNVNDKSVSALPL